MKKIILSLVIMIGIFSMTGCAWDRDSKIASYNVSKEADSFRVKRRIVFYNVRRDVYMLEIKGNCSIEVDSVDDQLEVICKVGDDKYQKHFLGLSRDVTYTVEQLDYSEVSKYDYEIVFKPESIIPIKIDKQ